MVIFYVLKDELHVHVEATVYDCIIVYVNIDFRNWDKTRNIKLWKLEENNIKVLKNAYLKNELHV